MLRSNTLEGFSREDCPRTADLGTAFVTMDDKEEAESIISEFNYRQLICDRSTNFFWELKPSTKKIE